MRKILLALAICFAAGASGEAAFRFGLGSAAAHRASDAVDEAIPAKPVLIMPISPLQAATSGQVIWPFGVQGGGHPGGHPGIDFNTVVGASVYVTATAKVWKIENDLTDGVPQKLVMLETSGYQIVYVGTLVNMTISPGDIVVKGQKLGDLAQFGTGNSPYGFLHWGVNSRSQQTAVCPYDLMSSEAQSQIDSLFAFSNYSEKSRFPLLCNPCPPGGCR